MWVGKIANVTREVGPSVADEPTIDAGVALPEMLRTTLGPNGLDKMLVGNGTIILTNDGGSIVDRMDIESPAASVVADVARPRTASSEMAPPPPSPWREGY